MPEETIEEHESYGVIRIGRRSGRGQNLFGSGIQNREVISLEIRRASLRRSFHEDRIYGGIGSGGEIVECEMSLSQFHEAITAFEKGSGIPVTLRYVDGVRMKDPPQRDNRQMVNKEFDKKLQDLLGKSKKIARRISELFSQKSIKKSEYAEVEKLVDSLVGDIQCNLSFAHEMFNESIDKLVSEGKAELQGSVDHMLFALGLDALKKRLEDVIPQLPGDTTTTSVPVLENPDAQS